MGALLIGAIDPQRTLLRLLSSSALPTISRKRYHEAKHHCQNGGHGIKARRREHLLWSNKDAQAGVCMVLCRLCIFRSEDRCASWKALAIPFVPPFALCSSWAASGSCPSSAATLLTRFGAIGTRWRSSAGFKTLACTPCGTIATSLASLLRQAAPILAAYSC